MHPFTYFLSDLCERGVGVCNRIEGVYDDEVAFLCDRSADGVLSRVECLECTVCGDAIVARCFGVEWPASFFDLGDEIDDEADFLCESIALCMSKAEGLGSGCASELYSERGTECNDPNVT